MGRKISKLYIHYGVLNEKIIGIKLLNINSLIIVLKQLFSFTKTSSRY